MMEPAKTRHLVGQGRARAGLVIIYYGGIRIEYSRMTLGSQARGSRRPRPTWGSLPLC